MNLNELIDRVQYDFDYYSKPPSYMDSTDYIKYQAKADYAESILDMLIDYKISNKELFCKVARKPNRDYEYSKKNTTDEKTTKGLQLCAEWLSYCLSIGWRKEALDGLEKTWWELHDSNGKLKKEQ